MAQYRKKPVVVDAHRWDGNLETLEAWVDPFPASKHWRLEDGGALLIPTLEGVMRAQKGDWIIKGVAGEFYPCKPEIFARTYEAVGAAAESGS